MRENQTDEDDNIFGGKTGPELESQSRKTVE